MRLTEYSGMIRNRVRDAFDRIISPIKTDGDLQLIMKYTEDVVAGVFVTKPRPHQSTSYFATAQTVKPSVVQRTMPPTVFPSKQ